MNPGTIGTIVRFFSILPDAKTGSAFGADMVLGKYLCVWSEMSLSGHGLHEKGQNLHVSAYTGAYPTHTGI